MYCTALQLGAVVQRLHQRWARGPPGSLHHIDPHIDIKGHFRWFAQVRIGTKKSQKIKQKSGKIFRLSKVARAELQAF